MRFESARNAGPLHRATKLRRRRNEKRYQGYRATAARRDHLLIRAFVFVDRPLRSAGRNLRHPAFSLRQKRASRRRDRRCQSRRRPDRGNSGKESCSRDSAKIGKPIFPRARRDGDVQAIPSSERSGCATGSKERRWIGQGPNSWSRVRCSTVV
jgi:hypothetical protein